MNRVLQHLLAACGRDELTDGELLTRFLRDRENAAYAELVRRHSPMVWGVCCRLLRSHHDAEDAFQASFLVLVQKAASLPDKEMVGNWLYGVAYQTAVRMRALAAKRGMRERQTIAIPEPTTAEQYVWNDLAPVLDEELNRLPDKYRVLIVLCDLEDKTRKEVAQQLSLPEGTVASRLATARTMLAKRLSCRGVVGSCVLLGTVLSSQAASACVPTTVISSTIKAATLVAAGQAAAGAVSPTVAALVSGVTKAMFMSKMKSGFVVLVAALCFGGASIGLLNWSVAEAQQPVSPKPPQVAAKIPTDNNDAPVPAPVKKGELAILEQKLVGSWIGQGPCVGKTVFQADGVYHQYGYGPGAGHWEVGTWKIEWSELPPTLVLDPYPTKNIKTDDPKDNRYFLVKLNETKLDYRWSKHEDSRLEEHVRGTVTDEVAIRIGILDSAVQSYLGTDKLGGGVNLPPNLKTLVDKKVLHSSQSLLDPWGKEFKYDITGKKTGNKQVPDIWTETPDKTIIGNWSKRGK